MGEGTCERQATHNQNQKAIQRRDTRQAADTTFRYTQVCLKFYYYIKKQ